MNKPSLTRALHSAADNARQALRDPAVKDAAAGVLEHVGRKLADKAEHGATQLRARLPAPGTETPASPSLRTAARRTGVALAEAMTRSTALREHAGRQAAKLASHPPGGIAGQILQEAEATYRKVRAGYDGYLAEARAAADAEAAAETDGKADDVAKAEAELETHEIPTSMAAAAIGTEGPAGPSKVRGNPTAQADDPHRWDRDRPATP